jgi:hypothetical protein
LTCGLAPFRPAAPQRVITPPAARRPVRPWAALALTCLLLSGCSGGPKGGGSASETSTAGGAHGGHDAAEHLLAPEWRLGDSWTMDSPQGGTFTHAVSKDAGDDWVVDTDDADNAFFDARGDISFLGKVRKSDLAGSQGDQRVEFLRFPLTAGLNWTTTWDGNPTMVHVVGVKDGKASLMAMRADGTKYAEYTYSDSARYFSHFAFYDPKGESVGYEWTLRSSGPFAGTLVRWTLATLFERHGAIQSEDSRTFPVPAGFGDVWVQADLDCSTGAVVIAAGPPTGPVEDRGYAAQGPCPLTDHAAYALAAPTSDEMWGASVTAAPTTAGTLDLQLLGRTQVQFKVGEAPA